MTHRHPLPRRQFLRFGAAGTLLGLSGLGPWLRDSRADTSSGYKALVCVFLYGGNDGLNCIVPTDSRYAQYSAVRGALALPLGSLAALGPSGYGLHPALSPLTAAWNDAHLAPVFNVGPLAQPLTKSQYLAAVASNPQALPDSLYSHSDQQHLWQSASASAASRTGWGGRAVASDSRATQPVISVSSNALFGLSNSASPLVLPGPGSDFGVSGFDATSLSWAPNAVRKQALQQLYAAGAAGTTLGEAFSTQQRGAMATADLLHDLLASSPATHAATNAGIDNAFASLTDASGKLTTPFAQQMYQVAKLIANHGVVGGSRQVYFAQIDGFDLHGNQIASSATDPAGVHYGLLQQLGDGLSAFYQALKNTGLLNNVTLFTESDFGRTFLPNASKGTDHGWGNMQFVLGGAVKGGTTYGTYPSLTLGGPDDVGSHAWDEQGRWIPTTSVQQYAGTLLNWFLDAPPLAQLETILPGLNNFGSAPLLNFV